MRYPDKASREYVLNYLKEIGVSIETIAELAKKNQEKYSDQPIEFYKRVVDRVLNKRELLNHIMTMAFLDKADAKGYIPEPLGSIIHNDLGVYGVDEALGLSGASIFGTLATTNYSYLDKTKPGVVGDLDSRESATTFADDIVSMIVASAVAHCVHELA